MADDPREVLRAAGVECAEVEAYASERFESPEPTYTLIRQSVADATIIACARLVARYKWMSEHDLQAVLVEGEGARMVAGERSFQEVYDLGECYREHHQS